jgi:pimeloyl-ACP methyl ester carboxylesterase
MSLIAILIAGASITYWAYLQELQAIRDRLGTGIESVQTRHGPLEYYVFGDGPPVLVVHGAGGGYDHGVLIANAYGGAGFRWIVPSRFGYLGTPLPADASTIAQAEAFADLLDSLGIERVGILAMSGGVPPSLQFAQRYPERTSALALLSSAPYTPLTAGDQKLPVPIWVYQALFKSDFPFWLIQKLAPRSLDALFDVTPELRTGLIPEEEAMVSRLVASFQPVTWRIDGLNNEGAAINPNTTYHLEEISAPSLVIHAEDDHINPFSIGEYTAAHIQGAWFMPLAGGGHLLLGHQGEIRGIVSDFLRKND